MSNAIGHDNVVFAPGQQPAIQFRGLAAPNDSNC